MAHIVILGSGIGGMPAAYKMRDMLGKEHQITVVSALAYFQFVPSNPWVAVGWRKREEVILEVAPLLQRKDSAFVPKPVHSPHQRMWVACSRRDPIMLAAEKGIGALSFAFIDPPEAERWMVD